MTNSRTTEHIPVLEVSHVTKHYDGVVALSDVSLKVFAGEVMAILGDNGAGKSTLIKIISGAIRPSSGAILLQGKEVHVDSPADARAHQIETVYQDLALIDTYTIAENFYHGRELTVKGVLRPLQILRKAEMRRTARRALEELHITIPGIENTEAKSLSGGQRQAVAIARGAFWGQQLVLLDEPTAALGVRESREVLELMARMSARGVPLIVVSHNLEHVWRVCDRLIVMRRGEKVADLDRAATTPHEVVEYITGARRS